MGVVVCAHLLTEVRKARGRCQVQETVGEVLDMTDVLWTFARDGITLDADYDAFMCVEER